MLDGSKRALRREADRVAGERWRRLHDPGIAELAELAAALGATMFAAHRAVDPELLRRAQAGELTSRNTLRGTPERRAVDRATYLRRRAARPALPARAALGHRVRGSRPRVVTFFTDTNGPARVVEVSGVSRRDVHRAASYTSAVAALLHDLQVASERADQIKRTFRRRWRRRAPIAGLAFLADPDAVVALATAFREEGGRIVQDSGDPDGDAGSPTPPPPRRGTGTTASGGTGGGGRGDGGAGVELGLGDLFGQAVEMGGEAVELGVDAAGDVEGPS